MLSRGSPVFGLRTGTVLLPFVFSLIHRSIEARSYTWPSEAVTGSRISSREMGQRWSAFGSGRGGPSPYRTNSFDTSSSALCNRLLCSRNSTCFSLSGRSLILWPVGNRVAEEGLLLLHHKRPLTVCASADDPPRPACNL